MSTPTLEGTSPLISDSHINTFIAGEDLLPGVLVELTADWTVKQPTTVNSLKVVGVTLTKASNGGTVAVVGRGIVRAIAWGTIAYGDQVTNAPTSGGHGLGRIVADNTSKNSSIIGQCIKGASSGGTATIKLWA